ncbi:LysE/ArgO family amino acid transporter [Neisseria canis]|uniref:LysE/ArgO family amino acid transporter n=1 Tax=Neisseria canis TaxID=493 RepID=UPI0020119554|nr:LysE/ArgO family amino acid transporter [Neisseria canis]
MYCSHPIHYIIPPSRAKAARKLIHQHPAPTSDMSAFFSGFMITASLIAAIGAQNAFVLKQGLLKQHVGVVVWICWLCDFALISTGVFGVSALLADSPKATALMALAGGLFLLAYAWRSAKSAWQGNGILTPDTAPTAPSPFKTAAATLALTLLNPHVYIDTVMLIGGAAAPLPPTGKWHFLAGALSASGIWFTAIGYGARLLLPLFRREHTWQILDSLIALMMLYLAFGLLKQAAAILL